MAWGINIPINDNWDIIEVREIYVILNMINDPSFPAPGIFISQ